MYFYYKKLYLDASWRGAVEHKKGTKNTQTQASHGVLRRNQYKSTQQAEFVLPEYLFDPVLSNYLGILIKSSTQRRPKALILVLIITTLMYLIFFARKSSQKYYEGRY